MICLPYVFIDQSRNTLLLNRARFDQSLHVLHLQICCQQGEGTITKKGYYTKGRSTILQIVNDSDVYPKINITFNNWKTLIFSHIRRLRLFWGFKVLNFNIFGGFQKKEYFGGYEDFVDIFWGHYKIGLV